MRTHTNSPFRLKTLYQADVATENPLHESTDGGANTHSLPDALCRRFLCFRRAGKKKYIHVPRYLQHSSALSLIKKPFPPQDGMGALCGCLFNQALDLLNGIVFDVG